MTHTHFTSTLPFITALLHSRRPSAVAAEPGIRCMCGSLFSNQYLGFNKEAFKLVVQTMPRTLPEPSLAPLDQDLNQNKDINLSHKLDCCGHPSTDSVLWSPLAPGPPLSPRQPQAPPPHPPSTPCIPPHYFLRRCPLLHTSLSISLSVHYTSVTTRECCCAALYPPLWRRCSTSRVRPSGGRPPWRCPSRPSRTCRSSSSTSASSSSACCSSTSSSC
ncbi:hypothetical protein SRHO_G00065160 [Serrasalmus rhombeus]